MYKGKRVAVVVPAHNEERFIGQVLNTLPSFVDRTYVVNDASTDRTTEVIYEAAKRNNRITIINRERNGGVGAAIISGHKEALKDDIDVVAIMAGDGQMDPAVLNKILNPVVEGKADYAKGNRLNNRQNRGVMSPWRKFGNFLLTYLTKVASGYWHIVDPQNGYTAISRETLQRLNLSGLYKGFAFENDMLVKLNVIGARVIDVPHAAIYLGRFSEISYPSFIAKTSLLLLKNSLWRLYVKYMKRSFGKV